MTSTHYDRRWKPKVEDILQLQREQDKCKFAVAVCVNVQTSSFMTHYPP